MVKPLRVLGDVLEVTWRQQVGGHMHVWAHTTVVHGSQCTTLALFMLQAVQL
jgi:hypothetical protein